MLTEGVDAPGAAEPVSRGYEARVVVLLGLAYGFAFFDRQMMTFLTPFVAPELDLSNLEIGALGAGLSLTWALGAYLFGRWSDRLGVRKPFLIGAMVMFSLCSVISGLAPDFWTLLASRILMGAVEGPFLPIALAILAASSPLARRGLNTGLVQNVFGALLGGALAPVLSVAVAQAFGWRSAFLLAALPGLVLAFIVWRFVAEPPLPTREAGEQPLGIAAMLRHRNVALCAAISCMLVGSAVLCSTFLPVYFTQVRGWSPERMSVVMGLLGLCPPVGGILIPALSDRIGRRPPLILAGALMILTPLAALYAPGALVVGLMLLGWIGMGSFPLFMAVVPAETLSYRGAAAVMGLVVAIGELTGGVVGPLLAGRLADSFGLQVPLLISAACAAAGALIATALVETNPRTLRGLAGRTSG